MNLDLVNDLFNDLKENKFVQNFMKELSNYLEKNLSNNNFSSNSWIDLSNDDLTIFDTKITTKFSELAAVPLCIPAVLCVPDHGGNCIRKPRRHRKEAPDRIGSDNGGHHCHCCRSEI